jgi:hypothetical protein
MQKGKQEQWRKRTVGTSAQRGQAFVLEPHGDKRSMPRGLTVVTPSIARELHLAKVNVKALPKTMYYDKKDKDRVKYFMDLIQRGIVLPPSEIHKRPDGTWEILDGKHRIEAYRNLGYTKIPVVTNATVGEIATALGDEYEAELFATPRSFGEKRELARRAITAQRGSPLVTEDTSGAFDALNPLSSGETQTDEIIADRKRRVVKSGDLVAGKRGASGEFRTRTVGTEAQVGQHFMLEPHGDKSELPRGLQVAVQPIPVSPSVPTGKKYAGFDVQYVDQAITDKKGNKFMGMNYRQAEELGIYFPYSEDTILIDKSLSSEEREQTLEMQVRIIAKMKKGASYLEAHAQVRTEMPERVPKKAGFWDSAKALGISAMQRYKKSIEADTAKREKDKLFSDVSKMGLEDGIKAVDKELPLIEAKSYSKAVKDKVKAGKVKTVRTESSAPEIEVKD